MARRKSGHAGFSFPLKAVKKKNLAGLCSRSIAKGISNDYALSQLSSQLHTIESAVRESKRGPTSKNWKLTEEKRSSFAVIEERLCRVECSSSHLDEDLNKNPWLIRVHSAIVPLYISRIFAKTKRDICYVRGRRISLGLENVNGRDLFPFWIRETHRAINRIDSLLVYFRAA